MPILLNVLILPDLLGILYASQVESAEYELLKDFRSKL